MAKINQVEWHYTANGTQRDFAVPFVYIDPTDVGVRLNGVPTTAFTLQSSGYVRMNTAPASGVQVTVIRNTDARNPLHVFQQGSPLLPQPLDENFRQILYAVEEGVSTADTALDESGAATNLAEQALNISEQADQKASTAISTAASAESLAQAADSTATSALSTAGNAVSTAGTALSTANSAASTAGTAASNASTALSTANSAASAASTAVSTANAAAGDASQALSTANQALQQAGAAEGIAQSAEGIAQAAALDASTAVDTAGTAAADAAAALLVAGTASSAAQTALQTAEGIDAKATQALSDSTDAVQRVEAMEDKVENLEAGGVTSFMGRVGSVQAAAGDYDVSMIAGLQDQLDSKIGLDDLASNLGGAAKLDVGTTAGTVAAGDDSRIVKAVPNTRTINNKPLSSNVTLLHSDVGAAPAVHTHSATQVTGLGNAATRNVGTTSGTVAAGDDSRLLNNLKTSNVVQGLGESSTDVISQAGVQNALHYYILNDMRPGMPAGTTELNGLTNTITRTGIRAALGLDPGDVILLQYSGYSKYHTVDSVGANSLQVNLEHSSSRSNGPLKLATGTFHCTISRVCKFREAPFGLGQDWVEVKARRTVGVNYHYNTPRAMAMYALSAVGETGWLRFHVNGQDVCLSFDGLNPSAPSRLAHSSTFTILPVGASYKLLAEVGSIDRWQELR